MENPPASPSSVARGISFLGNDLLQNIIAKLPAQSFASAACVSRTWNDVCSRVLYRPVIASAISRNLSLPEAMKEALGKILSEPIRPQFAILCIAPTFNLDEAHQLITRSLGSSTPLVTFIAGGIIGRDALTDQFSEVQFQYYGDDADDDMVYPPDHKGISLTVGYVPGLKVDAIPLLYPVEVHSIDKFVMDINNYSASLSGSTAPEAIFMFGDSQADVRPVMEKLDYALPERTVIAGSERCRFRWTSMDNQRFDFAYQSETRKACGAVALVFARDKNTLNGARKINFHFAVAVGVTAVGPTYRVVSAKKRSSEFTTWLTAIREGENETLDGQQILNDIIALDMEMGDPILNYDVYIGVTKRRKYSIGSEKVKAVTSLSYHPVHGGDEQYLYVGGLDIKTGDTFRFYVPDPRFALRQSGTVSENFTTMRHREIIGGFVFSCCGRGETFFGQSNVDSSAILDNFPCIPLAGMFCGGEIGRGPPLVALSDAEQDRGSERTTLHVYSSIYVLLSCNEPSSRP